jgi:hypothetical protein
MYIGAFQRELTPFQKIFSPFPAEAFQARLSKK